MDDNNRFFKFVWRVNALLLAAIGGLGLLLTVYATSELALNLTRERSVENVVTIDPTVPVEEDIYLGPSTLQNGSNFVRLPLYREQRRSMGYYSKMASDNMVNVLFLDTVSGQKKWLLKGTNRQILSELSIVNAFADDQRKVLSVLYTIAEKDSDGDGRITQYDTKALAVANPDGSGYRVVLDNIERLYSADQIRDNRVLVVYAQGSASKTLLFNVPDFSVVENSDIPLVTAD
jgi:hypothetical protein